MRILYTSTSYPPALGGAQLHTHEIVRRLAGRHAVKVRSFWDAHRTDWLLGTTLKAPAQPHRYELDGVPVQGLVYPPAARLTALPFVLGYYAIRPWAIRHLSIPLQVQLEDDVREVARAGGVLHNCRIGREPISYASLAVARRHGVPFILVPYHHPRWIGWKYADYLKLYREADGVIALTEKEKSVLAELGVRPERIYVTGIGPIVDEAAEGEGFRHRHGIPQGVPLILFLGQKYRYKGIGPLLEATATVWEKHPEAHFAFVGPRTDYSRQLFGAGQDRRVHEIGSVVLAEKSQALAACTLLCLPSSQESFGGVFTEAWAFAKPVIGGDIPASREVIDAGENGLLAEPAAGPLAEAINTLLGDPSQALAMGARGQEKTRQRYNWDHLATLTEDAYQSVLDGKGASS